jgi:CubicO group peptidase (beta-lactamase class C family)
VITGSIVTLSEVTRTAMDSASSPTFEEVLAKETARGSNGIPGCVLAAIDRDGNYIYRNTAGYNSPAPGSAPINEDGIFWIASCTKLITSICALQMVEQGLINLDEDVSRVIPEMKNPSIVRLDDSVERGFTLSPAKGYITLRQLLTHTSGVGYAFLDEPIMTWRQAVGPELTELWAKVVETYTAPLLFEPGTGWAYGGGIDWAGVIVHRLSGKPLDVYMADHVFKPLSMTNSTFQLDSRPDMEERVVTCSKRLEDGTLVENDGPVWLHSVQEPAGGSGLWSSVPDYMKILHDLIRPESKLLKQETIDNMLSAPQIPFSSPALEQLVSSRTATEANAKAENAGINYALGGMALTAESEGLPKGTLRWGGLPNLKWFANREHGVAALYASQLLPFGDKKSVDLSTEFFKEVMRLAKVRRLD